jgi:predicted DNA-binding protein (UPF0278 family)
MKDNTTVSTQCLDVAKQLQKLGIECFINDSIRIKYNKEFNKYVLYNDCTINIINIINIRKQQAYNEKAVKSSWDIFKINKSWDL